MVRTWLTAPLGQAVAVVLLLTAVAVGILAGGPAGPGAAGLAAPAVSVGALLAVAVTPEQTAWAVGWTGHYPGHVVTLTEHWDGTTWTRVPSPSLMGQSNLYGVAAISDSDAWAVGSTIRSKYRYSLIEHWNGTAWTRVPSPAPTASLNAVAATSAGNAWAVGDTESAGGGLKTVIEHWDGTAWRLVPSPSPGGIDDELNAIAAISASDVWVVGGYHRNAADYGSTLIEHWNGQSWRRVPSPSPRTGFALYGVAANSAGNAWAVGYNSSGNQGVPGYTLIEHWNGRVWRQSPNPTAASGILDSVTVVPSGDAWAVGGTEIVNSPNGEGVTMVAHGGGAVWTMVPSPSPGGEAGGGVLSGVAETATGSAWAVGSYFGGGNGTPRTLIESWNGTAWTRWALTPTRPHRDDTGAE